MPHLSASKLIQRAKEQANRYKQVRPVTCSSEIVKRNKARAVNSFVQDKLNNTSNTPVNDACSGSNILSSIEVQQKGKNNVVSQQKAAVQPVSVSISENHKNQNTNIQEERLYGKTGGMLCNDQESRSRIQNLEPCERYDYSNLNPVKGVRPCCVKVYPIASKNVIGENSCCN